MSSSPKVLSESGMHLSEKVSSPASSSPRSQPTNHHPTILPSDQNRHSRPLSEIIEESFPPFDHQTNIVAPFNGETNRDLVFEKELSSMLLHAIIQSHAWSSTRPKQESTRAAQNIERKIVTVIETEKEQGMFLPLPPPSFHSAIVGRQRLIIIPSISVFFAPFMIADLFLLLLNGLRSVERTREQLNVFVTQMKTALAALTGGLGI